MGETGYRRVSGATRCSNGLRGFRVNIRKLSIQRLRVRFLHFFKVLFKWRKSYERAVKSFKNGISGVKRKNCSKNNQSKSRLISRKELGHTNSFYSEAIADCLEFIKRNSISLDDPNNEATALRL
ncbi:unnamed protein product [Amaranthus hypochondriacus]